MAGWAGCGWVRGTRREPIHGGSYAAIHGGIWSRAPTHTPPPTVGWWPRSKRRAARHFGAIAVAPSVLIWWKQRGSKRGHDRAQPRQSVAKQVERTGAESVRQSKAMLSPSSWADQRRADQSRADQSRAEQIKSPSRGAAFPLRTSPLSKGGHGWVGGTICRHGWRHMSLHGRTCSGSRQPTRARPNQRNRSIERCCSAVALLLLCCCSSTHNSRTPARTKKDGARRRRLTSTRRLGESKP